MAYCLLLLGLREEATVPLALQFWQSISVPLREAGAASRFLATLAHVVPEPPQEGAAALLQNASRFLSTRAVSSARKLLRQWLPAWLARGSGSATDAAAAGDSTTDDGTTADDATADAACAPALVLLHELCDADGWMGAALRGSNVFACPELEPLLAACRRRVLRGLLRAVGGGAGGGAGGAGGGGVGAGAGSDTGAGADVDEGAGVGSLGEAASASVPAAAMGSRWKVTV